MSIHPYLLTPLLFTGPLYALYLYQSLPGQRWWTLDRNFLPMFTTWVGIRNYIVVSDHFAPYHSISLVSVNSVSDTLP